MTAKTNPGAWSEDEIAILMSTYPSKGMDACMALLPGRTKEAIATRAKKHGLKISHSLMTQIRKAASLKGASSYRKWNPELDRLLTEIYTKSGTMAASRALGFDKKAIKNRAMQLGLRVEKRMFAEPIEAPPDWFECEPIQSHAPAGTWRAEIPAVRSVFDLAGVV